jgi:hypothetical protein
MIERLSQFIKNQGLSVRAFEQRISASDGMIRRAINNNSDIQSKWLAIIAENFPQLNLDWLLTGKGSMFREDKLISKSSDDTQWYQPYKEMEAKADRLLEENISLKNKIRRLEESDELPRKFAPNVSIESNMKRGSGAPSIITAKSEMLEVKNKGL